VFVLDIFYTKLAVGDKVKELDLYWKHKENLNLVENFIEALQINF
jgi:hypothetical protein